MIEHSTFYLLIDTAAILATAIMLYLTEKPMTEKPLPMDFAESVIGYREHRIHAMLDDAILNQYDIGDWPVDDIVADLLAYADLTDDETEEAIRPHVITWKANRSIPT